MPGGSAKKDVVCRRVTIERFNSILSLQEKDKECILFAIDGLLRDAKTRQAYS